MSRTQITQRVFLAKNVPRGVEPTFDVELPPGELMIGVARHHTTQGINRYESDHWLYLWVQTVRPSVPADAHDQDHESGGER